MATVSVRSRSLDLHLQPGAAAARNARGDAGDDSARRLRGRHHRRRQQLDRRHRAVVAAGGRARRAFPITLLQRTPAGQELRAQHAGSRRARGDVVALTDDDVLPATDWLRADRRGLPRRSDVTFVFGKVLPRWGCTPPPELLTSAGAGHLGSARDRRLRRRAAVDYRADSQGQRLPIGANLAFRAIGAGHDRRLADRPGKVNNTLISGEDHEIFMRLRRHGLYRRLLRPD